MTGRLRIGSAAAVFALLAVSCSSVPPPNSPVRQGEISVAIEPNPIVATPADDGKWVFPFVVQVSETGGSNVQIREVRADVIAFGRLRVHQERMTAEEIAERGYPTSIAAGETIRIPFTVRRSIADASLLESVQAEITIEARDEAGRAISANTSLRVRAAR